MDGGSRTAVNRSGPHAGLVALLLAVSLALVFWRVAGFGFLLYGAEPPTGSFSAALTTVEGGVYQPLPRLLEAAERTLFKERAVAWHLTSLLLHFTAGFLLWRFLARSTSRGWPALAVALLFALHPLQVEPVAWISASGILLAACFALIALNAWADWVRTGNTSTRITAHFAFALSLLCAPVFLPLPFVLVLLDRWPFNRPTAWRDKAGMFAIALAGAILAWFAQATTQELSTVQEVGILPRLANAVVAWSSSLRRLIAPNDLAAYYPFRFDHSLAVVLAWAAVLITGSVLSWRLRNRAPAWSTGWFWWLILQAPMVGLVQFGAQGTADRYSYLPLAGLFIMLAFAPRWNLRAGSAAAALALVVCGMQSARALPRWSDTITLIEHSVDRSGGSAFEHQLLSEAYSLDDDQMMALRHSSRALNFAPHSATAIFRQADLLFAMGNYVDAMDRYREGLRLDEARPEAWAQVARLYALSGDWEMSGRAWYRALEFDAENVPYILGLATAMQGQGLVEEELALYQRALVLAPDMPGVRAEIAWIHATSTDETLRNPVAALRLAEIEVRLSDGESPRAIEVHAAARAAMGEFDSARRLSVEAETLALDFEDEELAAQIRERRAFYLPEGD